MLLASKWIFRIRIKFLIDKPSAALADEAFTLPTRRICAQEKVLNMMLNYHQL